MTIRADRRIGLLLAGVIVLTCVAIGATIALPASDSSVNVEAPERSPEEIEGMKLFAGEGCYYCHTQYLRETKGDAAVGDPTGPDAFAGFSPSMLGLERSSDLSAAQATAEMIKAHGTAGSLDYLSDAELEALAAYLLAKG